MKASHTARCWKSTNISKRSIICSIVTAFVIASLINLTIINSISCTDSKNLKTNQQFSRLKIVNLLTVLIPETISNTHCWKYQAYISNFVLIKIMLDQMLVDFFRVYVDTHFLEYQRTVVNYLFSHLDTNRKVSYIHQSKASIVHCLKSLKRKELLH